MPRVLECGGAKEVESMTLQDIEQTVGQAGFHRIPLNDSHRNIFMRGANILNILTDGKWAFYTEIADGKIPDAWGKDLESLVSFLTSASKRRAAGVN
jgi:hypothetical protein